MAREHIWLSLVGPELQKSGPGRSWQTRSPDCSEPTAADVMVWLPRLVTADVWGKSASVVYVLATVCLHIQSLREEYGL